MMAIRRRRRPLRRDRAARWSNVLRGAAVAVAALGLVASLLIARGWQTTVSRQRDQRLDRTAASRTAAITGALATYENALQAARSLWLASDSVNRAEFSSFARSLNLGDRYPGLQGIGWRTVVTDDQAAGFVARTRRDGEPGFTIKPPGRRPVYYVTEYSYPRIPFSSPLGADARAVPGIVAPLEQARDTGQTTLSNQTTLPGDLDLPPDRRPVAFELFVPVYRSDQPGDGVAERRRRFAGWATGQFRADDCLRAAMRTAQPFTGVELHDGGIGAGSLVASYPEGFHADGPDVRTSSFGFGTRTFTVRYAPLPGNAATELVARADRALYAAKEGGRDRSCAAPAAGAAPAASWTPNR
jgi:CHASE1-domain containing sensor protein